MVKSGQTGSFRDSASPILDVSFRNPRLEALGLETLSLADARRKTPPDHFVRPQRPAFHLLVLYTKGTGTHDVDFVSHPVGPRTVVVIQPMQVHQFRLRGGLEASLLLVDPPVLETSELARGLPVWSKLSPRLNAEYRRVLEKIAAETRAYDGNVYTARLLQHSIAALFLEITRFAGKAHPAAAPGHSAEIHQLFTRELEQRYAERWSVRQFAQRLGYSERTLSRACLLAEGRTAKAVIDQRVALEAKRLLAHTDWAAAAIASHLGFTEPTNFVKFFKRNTGQTADAFRTRYR